MVKVATKYFLSLCILFVTGYGYLSAQPIHDTFAHDASALEQHHISDELHNQAPKNGIITSTTNKEKSKDPFAFVEEEEVEENKESSSKKLLEISEYYTTLLDTKQALYFSLFIKCRLQFCERALHFSLEEPLNVEYGVFLI